jgi:hypothetical protein
MGPLHVKYFWQAASAPCSGTDDGDPQVRWDYLAQRWLIAQFSWSNKTAGYYQCMAVSTTADATGSYYAYNFLVGESSLFIYFFVMEGSS